MDQDNSPPAHGPSGAEDSKNTEAKCILIYEDDPEILFLCKMLLQKMNYRIATLMRCDDVLDDVARIAPDFILMDLWIPKIGGEKAVMLIKENEDTRHIPVYLFSANAQIEEICKKTGANGFISKPFDIHAFKQVIAKSIG